MDFDRLTDRLRSELVVATGCTEPGAIAYCSAYAAKLLGRMPERAVIRCSGNIIKNTNSVTVPGTDGLSGIESAAAAGIISARPELELDLLQNLTDSDRDRMRALLERRIISTQYLQSDHPLHIIAELGAGDDSVSVEVVDSHTGIGEVVRNGVRIHERPQAAEEGADCSGSVTVRDIYEYARTVPCGAIADILMPQIEQNSAISREGLTEPWGCSVGMAVKEMDIGSWSDIIAAAAAGSDARMNGCSMPVVINSGSGNQGITITMPIVTYAKKRGSTEEELLRALAFANLVALREKEKIGKLSAYCGASSAAAASAAGIAFLDGAELRVIEDTLTNTLATISGMVCDGAKSSCASKIATALFCALLCYTMAGHGRVFRNGEGIVQENVEKTIDAVGTVAADGMRITDEVILRQMLRAKEGS